MDVCLSWMLRCTNRRFCDGPIPRPEEYRRVCMCHSVWSSATITVCTYNEYAEEVRRKYTYMCVCVCVYIHTHTHTHTYTWAYERRWWNDTDTKAEVLRQNPAPLPLCLSEIPQVVACASSSLKLSVIVISCQTNSVPVAKFSRNCPISKLLSVRLWVL
jgi:hypothetical protein